jgi:UDP-N-acetylmuramate dehydrogenase
MLGKAFDFISLTDEGVHVGAATKSGRLLSFAKHHNLGGFELLQKLPGTLGGMLKMNAGLKEWEIFNHLKKIRTCKGWIDKAAIPHGYRFAKIDGVIYEAVFEHIEGFDTALLAMFEQFRANQPQAPSCGSCFKNPPEAPAGKLLEAAGFKGKRLGNMAFSDQHANFLINCGGGTFKEALTLIQAAKEAVHRQTGISLALEIIILQ